MTPNHFTQRAYGMLFPLTVYRSWKRPFFGLQDTTVTLGHHWLLLLSVLCRPLYLSLTLNIKVAQDLVF